LDAVFVPVQQSDVQESVGETLALDVLDFFMVEENMAVDLSPAQDNLESFQICFEFKVFVRNISAAGTFFKTIIAFL
jgi:hypothetical protein